MPKFSSIPGTKIIGGVRYRRYKSFLYKREAAALARKLRKDGKSARVIETPSQIHAGQYSVYTRG